ncbi:GntR family transcriptional regulator [Frondihabitans cladoniiphilus]|uniref:HTH gntR-type domain-containing protein n=1 Tax=Frondihabitans cladoniiphilus TaxID=715785 RepID=A0ABP8W9Y4_9MICO
MPVPSTKRDPKLAHVVSDATRLHLQRAILDRTLTPGEVLDPQVLGDWLGVTPRSVEDATIGLVSDGIAEYDPDGLARVTVSTPEKVEQSRQLDSQISAMVLEWAAVAPLDKPTRVDLFDRLMALQPQVQERSHEVWDRADAVFDDLVTAIDNPYLTELQRQTAVRARFFGRPALTDEEWQSAPGELEVMALNLRYRAGRMTIGYQLADPSTNWENLAEKLGVILREREAADEKAKAEAEAEAARPKEVAFDYPIDVADS